MTKITTIEQKGEKMKKILLLLTIFMISCVGTVIVDDQHPVENQCKVDDVQEIVCDIPCETNHCYQNCVEDPENAQMIWSWTMCFSEYSPVD